ncbi:arylsulfatase [Pontiella agarivorans]|uniref:Arylsulfatase n=1 Tax=Pontiella agarivorans TaxID=3038953 RepID=A0ABU5MSK9_9BACT|nr:arylsulfatase [Pontiella agarivorans]MDZ8117076.1 arylsulfatase [Pontiella agarivorans]
MKRNLLWATVCLLACGAHAAQNPQDKPNVIVIVTDDQGYGDLSCHGNPWLKTPELDRLHDDSVRLTDFHVDPTCAPTRAALMTGRYSARTGVWLTYGSRHHLRKDEVTMADVFKANGYRTAIFGKWHLGDNYPFRPTDRGFDEALIHGGGVVAETPDYWDNNYYDDTYFRNNKPEKVKGYCTEVWTDETIRFVTENKDRPFFCYLAYNAPHGPLHVPEKYRKPYEAEQGKRRAAFYGMIGCIDEHIGRLRETLNELSLERDTIVVFLNDNGTNGGAGIDGDGRNGWVKDGFNAGMRGRKTSRYEGGHRAACFIHWPAGGLDGGRDVNGVTAQIDLLPTFVDLCGLQFKEKLPLDGISLAGFLKSGRVPVNRTVVVHDQGRFGHPVEDGLLIKYKDYSVMQGNWRLVGNELYDIHADPSQRTDIAALHPEKAEQLKAAYESWWNSVSVKGDEYNPFIIDPAKQQTVLISSQNLLGGNVAYSQRSVRKGEGGEYGWTFIDVEKPGKYQISLRRWPRESGLAIRAEAPKYPMNPSTHMMSKTPCKVFEVERARLQIGDFDQVVPVNEMDEEAIFNVELSKGEQRIQTWFLMADGDSRAAYYTYIEPVSSAY